MFGGKKTVFLNLFSFHFFRERLRRQLEYEGKLWDWGESLKHTRTRMLKPPSSTPASPPSCGRGRAVLWTPAHQGVRRGNGRARRELLLLLLLLLLLPVGGPPGPARPAAERLRQRGAVLKHVVVQVELLRDFPTRKEANIKNIHHMSQVSTVAELHNYIQYFFTYNYRKIH